MTLLGRGCDEDTSRSADFFRLATEEGYIPAKLNLAVLYAKGAVGGRPDYITARILLRQILSTSEEFLGESVTALHKDAQEAMDMVLEEEAKAKRGETN